MQFKYRGLAYQPTTPSQLNTHTILGKYRGATTRIGVVEALSECDVPLCYRGTTYFACA